MCGCQRTSRALVAGITAPAEWLRKLHGKQVVGVTGFEPVTLRLSSACSNQLSYTPAGAKRGSWWS